MFFILHDFCFSFRLHSVYVKNINCKIPLIVTSHLTNDSKEYSDWKITFCKSNSISLLANNIYSSFFLMLNPNKIK